MLNNFILKSIKAIIIFLILLSFQELTAQVKINSPYTRFGLGWLVENRFETRIMAMGGIRIGVQDKGLLNPGNPASYAAFDSTTFVFQGGVFGMTETLKTQEISENANYFTMSHLLFGFQVTRWWKTSLGVLPFSYTGYDLYAEEELEDIGRTRYVYQGSGGFNKLYWGNAIVPFKGLSVGFNASYLFGTISHERVVTFPDSIFIKNTRMEASYTAKDFYFDFGVQYRAKLKHRLYLISGLTFGNETKMNSNADILATTYYGDVNTVTIYTDTIINIPNVRGNFILPREFGVGFSLHKEGQWLVGADFDWQNWKSFSLFDQPDSLQNSWHIAVGGEIIPDRSSIDSYWDKVSYRLGFRYERSYLKLRNTNINEIGISFGLGFPLRRSQTTLNLAVEIGKRGTLANDLIQENFVRFTFSVNIFEHWFIKSKYF